jgi:hypothetical protein
MKSKLLNGSLLVHPSALIPILMSIAALSLVLIHAAIYGIVHETDEGTSAHIFQLLMIAQLPIIVFFGFKWFKKSHRQATRILVIQITTWLAAIAAVYWLT